MLVFPKPLRAYGPPSRFNYKKEKSNSDLDTFPEFLQETRMVDFYFDSWLNLFRKIYACNSWKNQ